MNWPLVCGLILFLCILVSIILVSIFSQESPGAEMIQWDRLNREKAKNAEAEARKTLSKPEQLARIWAEPAGASQLFKVPAEYLAARKSQFANLGAGGGAGASADLSKGIVLTASDAYAQQASTLILELRQLGCNLPIELWYRSKELSSATIQGLQDSKYRVLCHCIDLVAPLPVTHKFSIKVIAMYLCTFDQFLYLDADNHVLADPTPLFDAPEFQAHGALFWPDRWPLNRESIAAYQGWTPDQLAQLPTHQQNTAQVMLQRERYATQLWMIYRILENGLEPLFPAPYNYGDKDVFHSTWIATGQRFGWIAHPVREVLDAQDQVVGLCQMDPAGKPLFLQEITPGPWVSLRNPDTLKTAPIPGEVEAARKTLQLTMLGK